MVVSFSQLKMVRVFVSSNGQWIPYGFPTSVILSFVLGILGVGLVLLGRRLKNSVKLPYPGKPLRTVIILLWVLSLVVLLRIYLMRLDIFPGAIQSGPVFPITIASAVGTFIYLVHLFRHEGIAAALGNGLLGAAAGPMVFELPFDCVVLPQIKAPRIEIIIFFIPLFIAVFLTLSLLLVSKHVFITRYSIFSAGGMFIIFAGWALIGFSYPSSLIPLLLNAISKVLSFITVAALFSQGPEHMSDPGKMNC